jgi:hypothetical protein
VSRIYKHSSEIGRLSGLAQFDATPTLTQLCLRGNKQLSRSRLFYPKEIMSSAASSHGNGSIPGLVEQHSSRHTAQHAQGSTPLAPLPAEKLNSLIEFLASMVPRHDETAAASRTTPTQASDISPSPNWIGELNRMMNP